MASAIPPGDRQMQALLEGFAAKGFALAVRMLGNADDAAEAVQDGLLVLWRSRAKLDPKRDPKAWFYQVVRNRCVDRLRRRRLETTSSIEASDPADATSPDPSRVVEADEYHQRLRRELNALPEAMREILYLRDFHDLPYAAIAEVLGIASGTVMSRLHRARTELRDRMLEREARGSIGS